ncbi:MAG: D-glycero-beta-D-manno-heptose-7-phosphate kinase [Gemmatimonadales bacterium]|nr:D-glycero-beta-D-manno-heptose-7-phosphate kinase [Gemmatimonadales bacterium]
MSPEALTPLTRERMTALLSGMATRRVVVVGDVMLDRYLIGDTDRLSPEAPVPVVTVRTTRSALGGAANVAANVAALGATGLLTGAVGDDEHAAAIRAELAAHRLDDRYLVPVAGRPTTTKTRVIARGQQVVRIDEERDDPLDSNDLARLWATIEAMLASADALVLEDYNKGTLGPALIRDAVAAARRRGMPVVVDPKYRHFFEYRGATVFKPNRRELEAALGAGVDISRDPLALIQARERLAVDNLLVTLGAEGMALVTHDGRRMQVPSRAREVYDVSGAGDTVTAWVATALAAGASVPEAAFLANYAAGLEVAKAGVATVAPAEVLAAFDEEHDAIGRWRRGGVI